MGIIWRWSFDDMYKSGIYCIVLNVDFSLPDYIRMHLVVSKMCMCKEFIQLSSSFYYSWLLSSILKHVAGIEQNLNICCMDLTAVHTKCFLWIMDCLSKCAVLLSGSYLWLGIAWTTKHSKLYCMVFYLQQLKWTLKIWKWKESRCSVIETNLILMTLIFWLI